MHPFSCPNCLYETYVEVDSNTKLRVSLRAHVESVWPEFI
jgi:hypothetical protein